MNPLTAEQQDAAVALLQGLGWVLKPPADVTYGCHVELHCLPPGALPDGCVLDEGRRHDCMFAARIAVKEECRYWRRVTPESIVAAGGELA